MDVLALIFQRGPGDYPTLTPRPTCSLSPLWFTKAPMIRVAGSGVRRFSNTPPMMHRLFIIPGYTHNKCLIWYVSFSAVQFTKKWKFAPHHLQIENWIKFISSQNTSRRSKGAFPLKKKKGQKMLGTFLKQKLLKNIPRKILARNFFLPKNWGYCGTISTTAVYTAQHV